MSNDKKYDTGKPMVGLMKKDFSKALMAVARVSTYGVEKYNQPGSWRQVQDALVRYEDAHGRHDLLMHQEDHDDESKLLHAAHRAWNALATLEMLLDSKELTNEESRGADQVVAKGTVDPEQYGFRGITGLKQDLPKGAAPEGSISAHLQVQE